MSNLRIRFVAKAVPSVGWRVWDRMQKKWWGAIFQDFPERLLAELNGPKRPRELVELARSSIPI